VRETEVYWVGYKYGPYLNRFTVPLSITHMATVVRRLSKEVNENVKMHSALCRYIILSNRI